MRKNKLIFLIILILIVTSIIYGLKETENTKPIFFEINNKTKNNKYKKISFYKQENYKRYINYQEKNKNLKF